MHRELIYDASEFDRWRADATARKCHVLLVTKSTTNSYYQASTRGGRVVGYFNTCRGGRLNDDDDKRSNHG